VFYSRGVDSGARDSPSEEPPQSFFVDLSSPVDVLLGTSSVTVSLVTHAGKATILVITSPPISGAASSAASLGPFTVTEEDGFGSPAPAPAGGTQVALSSTSAEGVFAGTDDGPAVTSVTLPPGASSASFYYGDTAVGTPTLTVATPHLESTGQEETVNPGAPAELVVTSSPVAGTTSAAANVGPITVTEEDAYGNEAPAPSGGETLFLASSSPTGVFAASQGGAAITSVAIPAGSTSVSFYYGDTTAGSPEITAGAEDLTTADQTETVAALP
jgi:hypothetical protein